MSDITNAEFDRIFADRPIMALFRGLGAIRSVELARTAWSLGVDVVELPIQSEADVEALAAVIEAGRDDGRIVGAGTVVSVPQMAKPMNKVTTSTVTSESLTALPTATPTPAGPPVAR